MAVTDAAPEIGGINSGARTVSGLAGRRRAQARVLPYALLAPSLIFLGLFTYLPVIRVAIESLYDKPHGLGAAAARFVGGDNYARVLGDPAFRQAATIWSMRWVR
jgi:ABC-type sugar transport system permease subunit